MPDFTNVREITFKKLWPTLNDRRLYNLDATQNVVRYEKLTVDILNRKLDDVLMIDAYSTTGFKLNNGLNIYGPLVMLPRSVIHWNVANIKEISIKSLTLFHLLEPKPDMIIIGVGDDKNIGHFDTDIIRFMNTKNISVEPLSTAKACALYNLMVYERRMVVGAFLPPDTIKYTASDNNYLQDIDKLMENDMRNLDKNVDQALKPIFDSYNKK